MSKRELPDVIDAMLLLIPDDATGLRAKLESIRNSAHYTPPEAMGMQWRRALDVLVAEIGTPRPGWEVDVATCFRGEGGKP